MVRLNFSLQKGRYIFILIFGRRWEAPSENWKYFYHSTFIKLIVKFSHHSTAFNIIILVKAIVQKKRIFFTPILFLCQFL